MELSPPRWSTAGWRDIFPIMSNNVYDNNCCPPRHGGEYQSWSCTNTNIHPELELNLGTVAVFWALVEQVLSIKFVTNEINFFLLNKALSNGKFAIHYIINESHNKCIRGFIKKYPFTLDRCQKFLSAIRPQEHVGTPYFTTKSGYNLDSYVQVLSRYYYTIAWFLLLYKQKRPFSHEPFNFEYT